MKSAIRAAIYRGFCRRFDRAYRKPSEAMRKKVWDATIKHGFRCKKSLPLLIEAIEVQAERMQELERVARALREYIDAIPADVQFNVAMPGVDRDWVDSVIDGDSADENTEAGI